MTREWRIFWCAVVLLSFYGSVCMMIFFSSEDLAMKVIEFIVTLLSIGATLRLIYEVDKSAQGY